VAEEINSIYWGGNEPKQTKLCLLLRGAIKNTVENVCQPYVQPGLFYSHSQKKRLSNLKVQQKTRDL